MRIAIDASPLLDPYPTGVGRAVREIVRELARREPEHEVLAVAPNKAPRLDLPADAKTKIEAVAIPSPTSRWRFRPADELVSSRKVDVFYSPVSAFPFRAECARVATVHEVPWEVKGLRGDEGSRMGHRVWATLDAWYADRIVCPTKTTAEDFLRSNLRKGAKSKVAVVPWGVGAHFDPKAPDGQADRLREAYRILADFPFFLVVASPRKKKNFELAMRALRAFRDRTGVDARLVIVGPEGPELQRALGYADGLDLRRYVSAPGYVPDEDLPHFYRNARATLVLSRSEGFGFTVVESMACGTPVLYTPVGALEELAGDAGVRVPLDDEEAVAKAMAEVHREPAKRDDLAARGKARAAQFRWPRTVDQLLAVLEEVGAGQPAASGAH
ncbi:MAG TPA: glycosyltransferase family 1 protein [Planctomycetota bacterium]|nr:glycosyltransferase family 1 protein [Planctomycetota bacterium]